MVRRDALGEYVRGSLWVLPTLSVLAALVAGSLLSLVSIGSRSPLAFQGTPDDARTLLIGIAGTMVTVIALLLGLTVVALQLSSTQFSPRLLRNFLRDRPNQVVLSAFVPPARGALVLLFVSLGLLVFFADHLVHSLQVGAIMGVVQRSTIAVIRDGLFAGSKDAPEAPAWPCRSRPSAPGTYRWCVPVRCCRTPPGTGSVCGCGPGSANTWSPGRRWCGSGVPRRAIPPRIRRFSRQSSTPGSGSGSSAPWSRTPRSESGNWSTWRARRCRRRSTIPTPRCRPSITYR